MAEFHAKSSERCERVDDETTAITGVVISVVGVKNIVAPPAGTLPA